MEKILGTTRFQIPVSFDDVASNKVSLLKNSLRLKNCRSSKKYITAVTGQKGNQRLGHWLAQRGEKKIIVEFDFLRSEKTTSSADEFVNNRKLSFFNLKWIHLEQMTKGQKLQLSAWLNQFSDFKSRDPEKILKENPELAEKILDQFPEVSGVIFKSDFFSVGMLRAEAARIAQAHVVHDFSVKVGI